MERELVEPIVEWLSRGYSSKENIKQLSLNYGYSEEEFEVAYEEALHRIHDESTASKGKEQDQPKRKNILLRVILAGIIIATVVIFGFYLFKIFII